jgi:hypothetical protein
MWRSAEGMSCAPLVGWVGEKRRVGFEPPNGPQQRVLRVLKDHGGELANAALYREARLTKTWGYQTLNSLVRKGEIERDRVVAPNSAGRMQEQILWRLIAA